MKQENKAGDYKYKIQTKKKTHSKFQTESAMSFLLSQAAIS